MLLTSSMQSFLAARPDIRPRWLFWVAGRNRGTGATETMGFWTGDDDETFSIDGSDRAYFGAGGFVSISEITYESGTTIQMQRLTMGPVTEEVELALRTYEPRLAPVDLHLALFDPLDNSLVGIARAFRGWIDELAFREGALEGGISATLCDVTLASSSREGTRSLPLKKSDSAQKQRSGDRGRRYAAVAGSVPVWWGEQRHVADESSPKKQASDTLDKIWSRGP